MLRMPMNVGTVGDVTAVSARRSSMPFAQASHAQPAQRRLAADARLFGVLTQTEAIFMS
jgi:hypothetical protein